MTTPHSLYRTTVTLQGRVVGHLWPEWMSFLLLAVIAVVLATGAAWIARRAFRRPAS